MNKEFTCPDCGYTWQQGQHGGHSCATWMKKIEDQAREIERLNSDYNEACEDAMCVARELGRQKMNCLNLLQQLEDLKAQSSGVVLPEPEIASEINRLIGLWDAKVAWSGQCMEELLDHAARAATLIARLNSSPVSAGEPVYQFQCREIGEGDWEPCDHRGYMYCQKSPEMDTRVVQVQALSAPSHGEQVREWSLAADELPSCGKPVLAYYLNSHGMGRRIRAMHVKRFTVEAEEFADPETQCCEYSEQDDCYYTTEGWYELIDNWPDYSSCAVIEGVITHWMPLPAAPLAGSQEQGE